MYDVQTCVQGLDGFRHRNTDASRSRLTVESCSPLDQKPLTLPMQRIEMRMELAPQKDPSECHSSETVLKAERKFCLRKMTAC